MPSKLTYSRELGLVVAAVAIVIAYLFAGPSNSEISLIATIAIPGSIVAALLCGKFFHLVSIRVGVDFRVREKGDQRRKALI